MNLQYFKSQICDELKGARDYAKLAMATRETNRIWSETFKEMSKMELDHVSSLFKMAEEYYTKLDETEQKKCAGLYRCIVNLVMEDTAKVKYMHEMLNQPASTPQTVTPKPVG